MNAPGSRQLQRGVVLTLTGDYGRMYRLLHDDVTCYPEPAREIGLRIKIDEQNPVTEIGQRVADIPDGTRLGNAAGMVEDRYHLHSTPTRSRSATGNPL